MKLQLNGNCLKIIAMISMFIDHLGFFIFPDIIILRIVGRISFPIYAYLISEGFKYTKHRTIFFLRTFILGLICSIAYIIATHEAFLCILLTFSVSMLIIYLIDYVKKSPTNRFPLLIIVLIITFYICNVIEFDYGFFGILVPVITYLSDNKLFKISLFGISLLILTFNLESILELYSLISIPIVAIYDETKGKLNLKLISYLFYPVHFLVIYAIKIVLF